MKPRIQLALCAPLILLSPLIAANWLSYGHDPQRTGWSPQETDINRDNAKSIALLWKAHLDNQPRELNSLTAPVNVEWVTTDKGMAEIVIVGGASDNLFALDANSGKLIWKKSFEAEGKPHGSFWLCPNALNDTPLIRKDGLAATVFVIASDGKLHTLNAINGEDRTPPQKFVPPFSKNWSLNLVDNVLYTNLSQGCNGARSGVYAMDLGAPDRPPNSSNRPPAAPASGDARAWPSASTAWSSRKPATDPTMPLAASFPTPCLSFR